MHVGAGLLHFGWLERLQLGLGGHEERLSLGPVGCTLCLPTAPVREMGVLGFRCRAIGHRRTPIAVHSRLLELRCRARPRHPSVIQPAEHPRPHDEYNQLVRRQPHNPRRQRLEPLVVPPLRLGHLGALLQPQLHEGTCRGTCPELRAYRLALLGLEVPLRGLHVVPRVGERCTEVEVRHGPVGPQGDGLAVGPGFSARVILTGVPCALSQQLIVRVARPLRGLARGTGRPLRDLAKLLPRHPTILALLPPPSQCLVKRPVQLPSARVRRAVHTAEVRRRQLFITAHVADGVLLSLVVHV
eukprot:scaffold86816_cov58-Phaeocystis_antarctica.AAC.2